MNKVQASMITAKIYIEKILKILELKNWNNSEKNILSHQSSD